MPASNTHIVVADPPVPAPPPAEKPAAKTPDKDKEGSK